MSEWAAAEGKVRVGVRIHVGSRSFNSRIFRRAGPSWRALASTLTKRLESGAMGPASDCVNLVPMERMGRIRVHGASNASGASIEAHR